MNLRKLLAVLALIALPASASAQDETREGGWKFSLGAGAVIAPNFLGDDDYKVLAVPGIRVAYEDQFSASIQGIRYSPLSHGPFRFGAVLAYDFGRDAGSDDNPFTVAGGNNNELIGLGDIDGTIEVGGFVEYDTEMFSATLELRRGVDGGHDGFIGKAEAKYKTRIDTAGPPVFFSIGPALVFGDNNYNSTFFDVNAAQSAASGISQYDADGGLISVGLHARVIVPLSQNIAVIGSAGYDRLTGDVADSSIVSEVGSRNQVSGNLFLTYTF